MPTNAAAPARPTLLRIRHAPDNDASSKDKEADISRVGPTCVEARTPIIPAKPATTNVITPSAAYADGPIVPLFPIRIIDADNDNNSIDKPPDAANALSVGSSDNCQRILANAPTTSVSVTNAPVAFFAFEVAAVISENVPMTIERAIDAVCNFSGSINEREPRAIARIAIVADKIISVLLQSSANFVTAISAPKTVSRTTIAPSARFKPSGSTLLKSTMTPDKTKMAPDIINSMEPAFAAFFPAYCDSAIMPPNIRSSFDMVCSPRSNASGSISAIILIA